MHRQSTRTGPTGRAAAAVVAGAMVAAIASGADWPQYRGPNRDGTTSDGIDRWPPTELWRAQVGQGYSCVVVSGGYVYAAGWGHTEANKDTVYCFDEDYSGGGTQTPVWVQSYDCASVSYQGTRSTPAVDGSEVYMFSHEGRLSVFDRTAGTPRWNASTTWGRPGTWNFGGSPLVEGTVVIVNASGSGVAFRKADPHDIVWPAASTGTAGYSSPWAYTDATLGRTVVIHGGSNVSGVDPVGGTVRWYFSHGQGMADPIVYNGYVWASRGYGGGATTRQIASDNLLDDTAQEWTIADSMRNKENCSVFHNGYVYGFSEDAGLRCVDFATGAVQWTNGAFGTESALIMANGELVAISGKDGSSPANGSLVVFQANPAAYTELHRQDNILGLGSGGWTWTAPTVANGKLYLRGHGGLLVCYDVTPLPQITVASSPSGRTFTVDGGSNATAPQTYSWGSATNHTLATTSPQGSGGTRYVFASWTYASSTNTNLSFSYAVPASDQTVTANFGTEHQLTTAIAGDAPAGTVTPASGSWHAANSDISVLATPAAATSAFDGWSGALTGRQNPGSLRMSGPRSVTATFRTDTDMDGMPDYWETLFALNPNDSGDAGTDADGDGDTNVEEYQASTNPKVDDGAADEGDGASGLSCTQGRSDAAGLLVLCLALAAVARRRLLRA